MSNPPRASTPSVDSSADLHEVHDSVVLVGNTARTRLSGHSILSRSPCLHASYVDSAAVTLTRLPTETESVSKDSWAMIAEEAPDQSTTPLLQPAQPIRTSSVAIVDVGIETQHFPLSPNRLNASDIIERKLAFAYNVSWVVNIFLFIAKAYAYYRSRSSAVLASLADSGVDLVSQLVIFYAEHRSKKSSPAYPVGQARLETIGVLACACVMSICSFEVIKDGSQSLWAGFMHGELPYLDTSIMMFSVLAAATGLKVVCYVLCAALQNKSDSMTALAEDHLNDIMSNMGAIVTAGIAGYIRKVWYLDPVGGILISAYIVWRWADIAKAQVEKVVGKAAPPEFLEQLFSIINAHHHNMNVDTIRAYHSGARFLVEVEVVMPPLSLLKDVHDVSLELQHKLELLEEVERAFVHVDYEYRSEPEHKIERRLLGLAPALSSDISRSFTNV